MLLYIFYSSCIVRTRKKLLYIIVPFSIILRSFITKYDLPAPNDPVTWARQRNIKSKLNAEAVFPRHQSDEARWYVISMKVICRSTTALPRHVSRFLRCTTRGNSLVPRVQNAEPLIATTFQYGTGLQIRRNRPPLAATRAGTTYPFNLLPWIHPRILARPHLAKLLLGLGHGVQPVDPVLEVRSKLWIIHCVGLVQVSTTSGQHQRQKQVETH